MNERALICRFQKEFNAYAIDYDHRHEDEDYLGPFKPLVVNLDGKKIGCVEIRKQVGTEAG